MKPTPRFKLRVVLLLLGLGFTASWNASGPAADIFVDNVGGSDRSDGRSTTRMAQQGGPVKTIAKALRLAATGDRIVLTNNPEPYHESVSLVGPHNSGTLDQSLQIVGNGATLDGSEPISQRAWEHVAGDVYRFAPRGLAYQILYRDGIPLPRHPVSKLTPSLPKLLPLEWCLYDGHVYFRIEKGKYPFDYKLAHTVLQTGVTLYDVRNVLISNLIVQGFRYDGINAADRATDVRLSAVTLRGNGRSGLAVCGASQVWVDHALIGDNGEAQVRVESPARLFLDQSEVLGNTAPRFDLRDAAQLLVNGRPPAPE